MTTDITSTLVSRCLSWIPDRIPVKAMDNARDCLIDGLAVAIAARNDDAIETLRAVATSGAPGGASLIGRSERVPVEEACLVNGMMISLLLFDDNHASMRGHPTAPILPVVLALGEDLDLPLDRVLRAFILGYEVESWLGLHFNPSQYELGWHATATQGTLGATVAAAWLLGLTQDQTRLALGIAASMLGGVRANFGTMTMSYHSGLAAAAGMRAARLAQAGFTATPDILDGPLSIGNALSREWDAEAVAASAARIGEPLQIVDPGLIFKIYPCGRPTLPAVDCAMEMQRRFGISCADIAAIRCEVSFMYPRTLIHPRPKTGLQGKTSLECCVASAFVDNGPRLDSFTDAAVARPEVQRLIEATTVVVPPELSEDVPEVRRRPFDQPVTMVVTTTAGDSHRITIADHRGMPGNPATAEDMRTKFANCAGGLLDAASVDAVFRHVALPGATTRALMALVHPAS
jgi:2-methylcitrate dehydratase PrpD